MNRKENYIELCKVEPSIPIFLQPWWLDCVCGESNWDVGLVYKGDSIAAAMPYYAIKKYGLIKIAQPQLTQHLGPWIRPSKAKYSKALGQEKDLLQSLVDELPAFITFHQSWHFSLTNWLPLYWKGFSQTTKYTYRIPDLTNLDVVLSDTLANIKTDIKKANNKYELTVHDDLPFSEFFELNKLTFSRQSKEVPYKESFVENLITCAVKKEQAKWFIAQDNSGKNHAGVLIVWDENSAYYLMGGGDPELRNSGATSLCMWEAIKFSSTVTKGFDFEGSMIEPVERFFRSFGGIQTPYFSISKNNSRLLKIIRGIRGIGQ